MKLLSSPITAYFAYGHCVSNNDADFLYTDLHSQQ